jgi:hypothetical protein
MGGRRKTPASLVAIRLFFPMYAKVPGFSKASAVDVFVSRASVHVLPPLETRFRSGI